jgi:predicted Zn-dependent peptidase
MSVIQHELANGLRLASEAMPGAHSAAFAIAVNVGARHETSEECGLSHLLEHMAFKGTDRFNARQIAEKFDRMGGNVNAYTSHEQTVYHAKVLKEYGNEALELLCEIVRRSNFDGEELEREREVILQEIAMHQDSPEDVVFDLAQQSCYGEQALGRSILGTPEHIRRFAREDLLRYTSEHYQPTRMVITAAGAVDAEELTRIAGEYFGDMKRPEIPAAPTAARHGHGIKTLEKDLEQVQLVLGFPSVSVTHPDYYTLQVLSTVLGGGMSSRLFQEIREKLGLAYSVSSFFSGYQDTGSFGIYAGTTKEHLGALLGALERVMRGLYAPIAEDELLRAKNQMKAGIVMARENPAAIAEWLARHLLIYGRVKSAEEILGEIDAVTSAALADAARQTLAGKKPAIAALGPYGSLSTIAWQERLAA